MNVTLIGDLIYSAKGDWCALTHATGGYPGIEKALTWDPRGAGNVDTSDSNVNLHSIYDKKSRARILVRQIMLLEEMVELHVSLPALQEADDE